MPHMTDKASVNKRHISSGVVPSQIHGMGHHRSDPLVPSPPHMADKAGAHRPREGLVKLVAGTQGLETGVLFSAQWG